MKEKTLEEEIEILKKAISEAEEIYITKQKLFMKQREKIKQEELDFQEEIKKKQDSFKKRKKKIKQKEASILQQQKELKKQLEKLTYNTPEGIRKRAIIKQQEIEKDIHFMDVELSYIEKLKVFLSMDLANKKYLSTQDVKTLKNYKETLVHLQHYLIKKDNLSYPFVTAKEEKLEEIRQCLRDIDRIVCSKTPFDFPRTKEFFNNHVSQIELLEDFLSCVCEDLTLHPFGIKKTLLNTLVEIRGKAYSFILKSKQK